MIPVIKLFMVLTKTLAKPFVATIKKVTAQKSGKSRAVLVYTGNQFHKFDIIINRRFLGLEGK